MVEATGCVVCGEPIRPLKRALVAPFIARRIWNRDPFCLDLVQCQSCTFMFYNPRLDDAEVQLLYRNYRSEEYQKMRWKVEPWYTPKLNANLASPSSYRARRAKVGSTLRSNIGPRTIHRVLDYGGDRGDLVAGLLDDSEAYVYDISGIPAAPGVVATSDPAACKADLIINSNVLEHVGFPRTMVSEMLRVSPENGLLYLEVPSERPTDPIKLLRRIAQIGIIALTRPALGARMVRLESIYMMHEHINYFTERSLTALLRAAGGTLIASGTHSEGGRDKLADTAWCLGTRDPERFGSINSN